MLIKILVAIIKPFLNIIYKIKIEGADNFISDKPFVLICNHKSMMDPVLLYTHLPKKMHFMAKKELFDNKFLNYILKKAGAFPINRGKNDINAIKTSMKVLKDGNILGIFPQGTRVDDVQHGQAKSGAFLIASKCNVPVLPVAIKGDYKFRNKITIRIFEPYYFEERKYSMDEISESANIVFDKILDYLED